MIQPNPNCLKMEHDKPLIPDTAPLAQEDVRWLNGFLPKLGPEQLTWLEGFINGLRAGQGQPAPAAVQPTAETAEAAEAAAPAKKPELTVLYGSESGNAESLADQTAKDAEKSGFKAKVLNMADAKPDQLSSVENLLVLVSTWGEGDPPEPAADFYEAFMGDNAPKLKGTRYSVLGLGDTSYEHFCQMGKDFDTRLETLGGDRVFPRQDCDVDYDEDFAAWQKGAFAALESRVKEAAPADASGNGGAAATAAPSAASAPAKAEPVKYSRKNPFPSPLKERLMLNGRGAAKETIHLEFDLAGSGLQYEVGDALAVIPHNDHALVDEIIRAAHLDADEPVSLKDGEFSLREALTTRLDVTNLSLPVLNRYYDVTENADLDKLLKPDNKQALQDYLYGREMIDVLNDFPAKELTAEALVSIMRKLPPRLYSIASSLKAHPEEVHLTVGVVRYDTHGRQRKGVCSTFLADRIEVGETCEVFITPNKNFKLPPSGDTPIIMVGPGTGIAPFRAFLEERHATGAKGKNWLFFGDQHYLTDFLYQTEWQGYQKDGILHRLDVAFSRDQKDKIYVQDRLRENARDLYAWLRDGAVFYVCGDASRMAVDVDKALHDIVAEQGGMSEEDANAYVKQMKTDKRYLRDVY